MAYVHHLPRAVGTDDLFGGGLPALSRGGGRVGAQPDELEQIAHQFEALFLQQWLKQARSAAPVQDMLASDQTRMVQSLNDEQMARQLAQPGLGLAQALLDQMRGGAQGAATGAPVAAGSPAASAQPDALQAPSISALLDMLAQSPAGRAVRTAVSAVKEAPGHVHEFVARMKSAAEAAASRSGVPVELMLSQAALETGWGRREITHPDGSPSFNIFGIKATPGWQGKVVQVQTTEYEDGQARKLMQPFRAYGSYEEAFADYARLISTSERYSGVMAAPDAREAARSVQAAGYATDPDYASKLISIMGYLGTRPA